MNHITLEKAVKLARSVPMNHWVGSEVRTLCNAAIEWYIAQQAESTELTEEQLLWIARSHGINVPEGSLLGFYRDLVSTTQAAPTKENNHEPHHARTGNSNSQRQRRVS